MARRVRHLSRARPVILAVSAVVGQAGGMAPGEGWSRPRLTLAVACTAQVMMVLDVLIVSVGLPARQRELHLWSAVHHWPLS